MPKIERISVIHKRFEIQIVPWFLDPYDYPTPELRITNPSGEVIVWNGVNVRTSKELLDTVKASIDVGRYDNHKPLQQVRLSDANS